ncbi:MAG: sodium:calcium symporter [Lentisphaerae bacterium]|nr:sodium:calcium symporter [Lentisphaerota bacterium]
MAKRERWASRIGVILAMAGNAIGLGNFLRFPVQAAQNGGGAFMIPYFVALLIFGIPLAWCEWAMGRLGGTNRHGSSPGVLGMLWKHPAAKYLGALGICLPLGVLIYYLYVESWTLSYSFFSVLWDFMGKTTMADMKSFLTDYQGVETKAGVTVMAYVFFLLTVGANYWIMSGGIAKGIERLARIGMPALLLLAVVLVARVFTLAPPDPAHPENSVVNGLGFVWNPDLASLRSAKVWLAAAGQVFFTLSVGFGSIQCYASYMRRRDDIVVTGLSSSVLNEFVEVILGASIAIPAAYVFFGHAGTVEIAKSGSFNLGFVAMPAIFQQMPGGAVFGLFWFFLLFIAGLTSSVALAQPAIAFLQDELGWSHKRSLRSVWIFLVLAGHVPILGLAAGALDEMDFWAGTIGLALFALIESIVFIWIFGAQRAWDEIHIGAEERIPRVFFYILKYVTPVALLAILIAWGWQQGADVISMKGVDPAQRAWRWAARALLLGMIATTCWLIRRAWSRKQEAGP